MNLAVVDVLNGPVQCADQILQQMGEHTLWDA